MKNITRFLQNESGATAVEYGLLVGLIAVGIIAAVRTLGTTIAGYFAGINTALAPAGGS